MSFSVPRRQASARGGARPPRPYACRNLSSMGSRRRRKRRSASSTTRRRRIRCRGKAFCERCRSWDYPSPPPRFVEWVRAWLTNRLARVKVYGTLGRSINFKEGLPQESVLSPLLFIIVINDLLGQFEDATLVSAYADDLAIACRGASKTEITTSLQGEVATVASWSNDAKLQLNNTKCEVSTFSNYGADNGLGAPHPAGRPPTERESNSEVSRGKIRPNIEIQ